MKYIIAPLLILLLIACNPDVVYEGAIIIGNTDGMYVEEIDMNFKGVFVGTSEVNKRTVKFDVNNDGVDNFTISSEVDSISQISNIPSKLVSKITFHGGSRTKINVVKTTSYFENLPITDTLVGSVNYDLRHTLHTYCDDNSTGSNALNVLKLNNGDELISQSSYIYSPYNISIYKTNYKTVEEYNNYDFMENSYNYSCNNPIKNTSFYIGFKIEDVSGNHRLGWIELEILTDDAVHIIRTAVQD